MPVLFKKNQTKNATRTFFQNDLSLECKTKLGKNFGSLYLCHLTYISPLFSWKCRSYSLLWYVWKKTRINTRTFQEKLDQNCHLYVFLNFGFGFLSKQFVHFSSPFFYFNSDLDDDFYTKRQSKIFVQANAAKTLKISITNHEL